MSDHSNAPALPAQDDNQLIAERREKLKALRQQQAQGGGVAFPNDFQPAHRASALQAEHGAASAEALEATPVQVSVAGRMMLKRVMGKASFATVQDATGRIQAYVTRDAVGEEVYADFKKWDLGDIIAVERTGEARPGDFVVAVVDNEFTLKELAEEDGQPVLKPHNPAYPLIRPTGRLEIFGVMVGLVRRLPR